MPKLYAGIIGTSVSNPTGANTSAGTSKRRKSSTVRDNKFENSKGSNSYS